MRRYLRLFFAFVIVCLIYLGPDISEAATHKNTTGIGISPFLQQLEIKTDDTVRSFDLIISNNTDSLQEISLKAHDFGSLNETGGVILEGSTKYNEKYGLVSWMTLGTDTVLLPPHESRSVPVTITNRQNLQPGGHYAAVVASINSLDDRSGNKVVINQQLMSLVLVSKVGGERYDLKLNSINHNGNWLHLPKTVRLRFQNPGNVHVIPRGLVKLKSPGGTVIAQGVINAESAYVLPESFREVYVPLINRNRAFPLPGIYSIEVDYRYEQIDRYAKKKINLQYINLGMYILAAVLLAFGIRYFMIKKHHKKTTYN